MKVWEVYTQRADGTEQQLELTLTEARARASLDHYRQDYTAVMGKVFKSYHIRQIESDKLPLQSIRFGKTYPRRTVRNLQESQNGIIGRVFIKGRDYTIIWMKQTNRWRIQEETDAETNL